ncbi:MAG: radical SAM protein [Candidatus Gastranaerophilales bacterium]|nr:radical SAM protein [Candidatus Gastranaerophilales bacterium]
MIGDGENSLIELIEHIYAQRDINEVSNVIYKNKNNEIIKNDFFSPVNINLVQPADYSDYDLSNCKTISMMLSKGCYWGKCKFCSYNYKKNFQIKTIDNAINEIKHYIAEYDVKHISFIDDAIPPEYYNKLVAALIKNNINISFDSYAIFDKGFTKEVLANCKKAGISKLTWGLETHSKQVFDYISKSGCFEAKSEILKNAHTVGIYNEINVMEKLPNEKHEDLIQTVKFIYDNIDYIDDMTIQKFRLRVGSEFAQNPELYNLNIIEKKSLDLYYEFSNNNSNITENTSFCNEINNKINKNRTSQNAYKREIIRLEATKYLEEFAPNLL